MDFFVQLSVSGFNDKYFLTVRSPEICGTYSQGDRNKEGKDEI